MRRLNGNEAQLEKPAKGDRLKVGMAAKLREQGAMTVDWIAKRVSMGTAGYLNNRLYRWWRLPAPFLVGRSVLAEPREVDAVVPNRVSAGRQWRQVAVCRTFAWAKILLFGSWSVGFCLFHRFERVFSA
jgi:hypothetical protein